MIYIPEDALEVVKQAIFEAGAGRLGHYQECCWQTLGQGQFMPLDGSQPALGKCNQLEHVKEYCVHFCLEPSCLPAVTQALKRAHPYEEPAFGFIPFHQSSEES